MDMVGNEPGGLCLASEADGAPIKPETAATSMIASGRKRWTAPGRREGFIEKFLLSSS
jgi:hypothetical protein